jgi:hypothetical protein
VAWQAGLTSYQWSGCSRTVFSRRLSHRKAVVSGSFGVPEIDTLLEVETRAGNHGFHPPEKVACSHFLSSGPGGTWRVSSSSCSSLNSAGSKRHVKLSPAASLNSSRPFAHTWFLTVGVGGWGRG